MICKHCTGAIHQVQERHGKVWIHTETTFSACDVDGTSATPAPDQPTSRSGRSIHVCAAKDEMGAPLPVSAKGCGANLTHTWCERCDPSPAALCHWCHGRGYSLAPLPRRQRVALFGR